MRDDRQRRKQVNVCFSPVGDLLGGTVVVGIGIDAYRHVNGRGNYRAIAALPIALGLHQIDETFVWWWLQGHVTTGVGRVAMWIYLLFALVVLPTIVPVMVLHFTARSGRRRFMFPFVGLGAVVSAILFEAMVVGHPSVRMGAYHLSYTIGLQHGVVVIGLYIVATCGPMLLSGYRPLQIFGWANLVAVVILAKLCASGFASLWCFYAAIVGGVIALQLRVSARATTASPRSSS